MKIIWYGHSCFEITGNDGTVIFDPYQEGSVPGLNKLHLKGNLVLCSHDHDDHNARDCVDVLPKEFEVEKLKRIMIIIWVVIVVKIRFIF